MPDVPNDQTSTPQAQPTQPTPTGTQPATPQATQGQPTAGQPPVPTASAPPATPQNNQVPTNNGQNQPTSASANPPHLMSRVFDGILKTLTGGPQTYVDAEGNQQTVTPSRGSMGKAIVAAALAGLFTPNQYRTGYKGAQVVDRSNTLAAAGQAGAATMAKFRGSAQQMSDEEQTRRLMNFQNNVKLAQQMWASASQQHQVLDGMVTRNQATILKDVKDYQETDPSQKVVLAQGLTYEQAMQQMKGKFTTANAVVDGTVDVRNPATGVIEPHPTYTILNPDVKVRLSPETTDELAKFDRNFDDIQKVTNGNVSVPISLAVAKTHEANTLLSAENFFKNASQELNPDAKPFDLLTAYKNDRSIGPAIDTMEQALASHQATYHVLDAVRNSPNGNKLLSLIGTPEQIDKYIETKTNEAKEAATEAGQKDPDKRLADPKLVSSFADRMAAQNPELNPKVIKTLTDELGDPSKVTVGTLRKVEDKAVTLAQKEQVRLGQLQDEGTDVFGNRYGGDMTKKTYESRYQKFGTAYVQPANSLQKTMNEFDRILADPKKTGAEKVTALLSAVGISANPLKGKGFRINQNVIDEHAQARNVYETAVQKANQIYGTGGPITDKQIGDYAAIARGVIRDEYAVAAQEAQRQKLPIDFLPRGNGAKANPLILQIYTDAAGGDLNRAASALKASGWN